jgi:hypothetical protein
MGLDDWVYWNYVSRMDLACTYARFKYAEKTILIKSFKKHRSYFGLQVWLRNQGRFSKVLKNKFSKC